MKDTKIAHKRKDGGVDITLLAIDLSPEDIQKHISNLENQNSDYISSRIITDNKLPADRTFRDAWTDDNNTDTIDIDIQKAQNIKIDQLRVLRAPKLEELDVQYQIADEQNDTKTKQEVVTKKQELRDITNVELPNDVRDLKEFIPECLKP